MQRIPNHIRTDTKDNIARFEDQILAHEKKPYYPHRIVFYGNSYFAFWDDAGMEAMLRHLPGAYPVTINHGFGGATSAELLYYYPRMIKAYEPSAVVFTEGANDFEQGFTVKQAFDQAARLFAQYRMDFPQAKLVLLSPIYCPKVFDTYWIELDAVSVDLHNAYGALLRQYAAEHENCYYIDIAPFFYKPGEAGKPEGFRDLFRDDGVHLTDAGYDSFSEYLGKRLTAVLVK